MMKRFFLFIFLCHLTLSCNVSQQETDGKDIGSGYRNSSVRQEKQTENHSKISFSGVIVSDHDIPIYARLSSIVEELYISEGMRVKKGQELVLFDSKEMDINVKLQQNQLDQAIFQYESILVGQGYVPENKDDIPENVRKAARIRSSVELCESRLENARLYQSYCTVTAPIGGVITDLDIHPYDLVKEGTRMFHIVDTDHLLVEFFVLETDLKHFRKGTAIQVHPIADEEKAFTAEVYLISQKVNESGLVKIKAKLHEFDSPVVGMSVFISLL